MEYFTIYFIKPASPITKAWQRHFKKRKLPTNISCVCIYVQVQFSSAAQSCQPFCNPMDCSTPGFPVHHQLPELAQTHVHPVGDAIQPSQPLVVHFSSCLQSFPALNRSSSPTYKSCIFQKCKFVLAFKKKSRQFAILTVSRRRMICSAQ